MKKETENGFSFTDEAVSFKKVMRGYDPDEVTAYIDELNGSMLDAAKNYEIRMSEMNQELTLAKRENGTLRNKCSELEKQLSSAMEVIVPEPSEEETKEKEALMAEIDGLRAKLAEKESSEEELTKKLGAASSRIDELTGQAHDKEKELSVISSTIKQLRYNAENQEEYRAKYENAVKELETLRSSVETLTEEKEQLENDAHETELKLYKANLENSNLKTELSRISVENLLLSKKNEQHKAEINELKDEAKSKAYTYAEKITEEKAALDYEKISIQKKKQLQAFHIEQAIGAVDELKKQIEQISLSFEE